MQLRKGCMEKDLFIVVWRSRADFHCPWICFLLPVVYAIVIFNVVSALNGSLVDEWVGGGGFHSGCLGFMATSSHFSTLEVKALQ